MADVKFEIGRFALSTAAAGGTQQVTFPHMAGKTPKAVMFHSSGATVEDSFSANWKQCVGFSDGVSNCSVAVGFADAVATSQSTGAVYVDDCIGNVIPGNTGTGAYDGRFRISSFIDGGFILNITTQSSAAYLVDVTMIYGDDISNVHVGHALKTGSGVKTLTGVGFAADAVFMGYNNIRRAVTSGDATTDRNISFGVCVNKETIIQAGSGVHHDNAYSGGSRSTSYVSDTYLNAKVDLNALGGVLSITEFNADGWLWTTNVNWIDGEHVFLAVEFNKLSDVEFNLVPNVVIEASDTAYSETVGYTPSYVLHSSLNTLTHTTPAYTGSVTGYALSQFTGDNMLTLSNSDEDNAATKKLKSYASQKFESLSFSGDAHRFSGATWAFDATGFNIPFETVPATRSSGYTFVVGPGGAVVTPVDAQGTAQAGAATSTGTISAVTPAVPVDVQGGVAGQTATTTGETSTWSNITAGGSAEAGLAVTSGEVEVGVVTFVGPNVDDMVGTVDIDFGSQPGDMADRFTGENGFILSPLSNPLPDGLSVNPTTGNIEGTPTVAGVYTGIIVRGTNT